jgi:hypothetical protein
MDIPHYERNPTLRCEMDKDKQLPKCPECNGVLSSAVARGWCKGEWSDYYCHYCQQDWFEYQITQVKKVGKRRKWSHHA